MVHSFIAPQNTPFDHGLAKLQLTRRDIRNVFLEFIAMMLFTIWGSSAAAGGAPWSNGLVLAACIYLSDGGHVNPFVTLSALLTRNIKWHLAILYMIAQIAGAIVGAAWLFALIPSYRRVDPGCFLPNGVTRGTLFAWEALGTFFFILTVQSIALRFTSFSNPDVDLNAPGSFGGPGALAIGEKFTKLYNNLHDCVMKELPVKEHYVLSGFALAGIAWSQGQFTGASVNLSRTIASPIVFGCGHHHWTVAVYVLAGLLGTLLASLVAAVVYGIGTPVTAIIRYDKLSTRSLDPVNSHVWTGQTASPVTVARSSPVTTVV